MRFIVSFLLFTIFSFGISFKVATYNIQNFFDLDYNGSEYREYNPKNQIWNRDKFEKKLANISKVIKDLNSDIIAIQEIESKKALYLLNQKLRYRYSYFLKNKNSAVGVAILSRYKIVQNSKISIKTKNDYSRPILKSIIMIDGKRLILYINHWRSKKATESKRILYGLALKKDVDRLEDDADYIILGDLNSNYNEWETFKYNRKLNDTFNITAINQILNTTMGKNFVTKENIFLYNEKVHYNLWLDLQQKDRYSMFFKNRKSTPDNIIISKGMLDGKNISYINNSFNVFKPKYLIRKSKINRWNLKKGSGYSDHLPIFAHFTTDIVKNKQVIKQNRIIEFTIDDLYKMSTLKQPLMLYNCIVLYKKQPYIIVKQPNHRAIVIYNRLLDLDVGYSYDLEIGSIDNFNGLKEIKDIIDYSKISKIDNINRYYLDFSKEDFNILDEKYQNEIVTNIKANYKKGYIYFNNKKIKLYFDKTIFKKIKIKSNSIILIKKGHLTLFRGKMQIVIYKRSDFDILK